jgi:hypothetical protein
MAYKDPVTRRQKDRESKARYRRTHPGRRPRTAEEKKRAAEATRRWRARNPEAIRAYTYKYWRRKRTPCPVCGELKKVTAKVCGRCHCGEHTAMWKGGRSKTPDGYVLVRAPVDHPRSRANGYIFEHVLALEGKFGRYLYPDERVHHINGVRDDNRPCNLELWVRSHPTGQRVEDLLAWAREITARYA